jgi:hypothetical protein
MLLSGELSMISVWDEPLELEELVPEDEPDEHAAAPAARRPAAATASARLLVICLIFLIGFLSPVPAGWAN